MFDIAQPQVKSIENSTSYGKFEIEPLEPGFGTTLGNSLRRVLLSTLQGAAVTSGRLASYAAVKPADAIFRVALRRRDLDAGVSAVQDRAA